MGTRIAYRASSLTITAAVVLAFFAFPSWATTIRASAPAVQASSAILIDSSDGHLLYEKNSHERRAIASTTKIVTALVVLANAKLDDKVVASAKAAAAGASDPQIATVDLQAGETLTVRQLLYALLLESASDAAVDLAEYVGGSVEGFVSKMNKLATTVGAKESHFDNPHGLDDPDHYSTAYDLSLFARVAMRNPEFKEVVSTKHYVLVHPDGRPPLAFDNRNTLIGSYPGADGVKTGNTKLAGHSLVASADRGDEGRIDVVLSSPDPFKEAALLLDFGFNAFERLTITERNKAWGYITFGDGRTLAVLPKSKATILVSAGSKPQVRYRGEVQEVQATSEGQTIRVKVRMGCIGELCGKKEAVPRTNPAIWVWQLVGPVLRAITSS